MFTKNPHEIEKLTISGKYLTELLHLIADKAKAGMTLIELEFVAEHFLKINNISGAFKGYDGYPANLCLSVNDCVVHGEPNRYVLQTGDILKIDAGVNYQGYLSDAAISLIIGGELANPLGQELIQVTKRSLDEAVGLIADGVPMMEYGRLIESRVQAAGFSIIKNLTGHGIGKQVHEEPHIYNYPEPKMKKQIFREGMILALEPITAITSDDSVRKKEGENLYCKHGDIGAHWEYTIAVTKTGCAVLAGVTNPSWC